MASTVSKAIRISVFLLNLMLLLVFGAPQVSGLTQALCSSDNTGTSFAVGKISTPIRSEELIADLTNLAATSEYQSNGHCFDTCKANYAFAIVQYQSCWCSNNAPAHTTSVGSCNQNCPGYPFEQCGSQSAGLFGYIALNKSPSGTIGSSGTTPSNTPTSAPSSSSQPVSFQSLSGVISSIPLRSTQVPSSTASSLPGILLPSSSLLGSSTFVPPSSSVSSSIPSAQSSPPTPSPVTVQETVTAPPSVRISLVSIVRIDLSFNIDYCLATSLW